MTDHSHSTERQRNIWAPWRMEYIDSLSDEDQGCFLCRYRDDPANDAENLVLWRGRRSFVVLNRFPYTGGHSLIAPAEHVGDVADLDDETLLEMMHLLRDLKRTLDEALSPDGYNVGINIGQCAGAGLPGHLHVHVVPRWGGDTNFMPVFGGVRVIPQTLGELYTQLREASGKLGLPKLPQDES
ncbi:MAG: HIT family protein [Phycisphaerae bacterium]